MRTPELQRCSCAAPERGADYAGAVHETSPAPTPVTAPFHGLATVVVAVGADVAAGEVVAVLEAMKMEAPVTAPRAGVVSAVAVTEPAPVAGGDVLVELT